MATLLRIVTLGLVLVALGCNRSPTTRWTVDAAVRIAPPPRPSAPPPPRRERGKEEEEDEVPVEQARQVVEHLNQVHRAAAERCTRRRRPSPIGRLEIELLIDERGRVTKTGSIGAPFPAPSFGRCVEEQLRAHRFSGLAGRDEPARFRHAFDFPLPGAPPPRAPSSPP